METVASYAVLGFLLTGAVQFLKNKFPMHALLILAVLSFVGAGIYAVLVQTGTWQTVVTQGTMLIATANLIFNVFKAIHDGTGGDDSH